MTQHKRPTITALNDAGSTAQRNIIPKGYISAYPSFSQ